MISRNKHHIISKTNQSRVGDNMSGQIARIGLIASMLSVVGSLYLYFVSNDTDLGIFVGLWAPTLILASKEIEDWIGNEA